MIFEIVDNNDNIKINQINSMTDIRSSLEFYLIPRLFIDALTYSWEPSYSTKKIIKAYRKSHYDNFPIATLSYLHSIGDRVIDSWWYLRDRHCHIW